MSYRAHENLVAPARASASLGRLAWGVTLAAGGYLAFIIVALGVLEGLSGDAELTWLIEARTPRGVVVQLALFSGLVGSVTLAARLAHHRSFGTLVGPVGTAFRQGVRVAGVLAILNGVIMLMPLPDALAPRPNLAFGTWLMWLPLALPALLIQTGAEELAFRGYVQSQLAARFDNPVVWMGLPSALFAWLHYDPEMMGANALPITLWAGLFGMAAADLTARSGTLGPAIAFHFVNNTVAILFAVPNGPFDGLALYTYPLAYDDPAALTTWLPLDLMMILCSWLAARLTLRV